ncbi:hypothetical protein A7U60_g5142 [Sanghuangporus baumii]|uniref:Uncharacterized protein n=1 Tax=Sanghuangporus baumii TaxID=108892 RepID=A0A9Q5HY14_SANBA|nr:hypothetical protein A7U60_g5142 [Sanghuangporus baumii]
MVRCFRYCFQMDASYSKLDILMIRVLALFSRDVTLSIILKTLLAVEVAFKLGLIIYNTHLEPTVDRIIPMVYGAIIMILALYKAKEYWKILAGFKGFTLVKVLTQDPVLYLMLVILKSVFNIIAFRLGVSNEFLENLLAIFGNPSLAFATWKPYAV